MKPIKVSLREVNQPFKYCKTDATIYAPKWLEPLLQKFSTQIGLPEKPLSLSICHRREASPIHRIVALNTIKLSEYSNSYLFLEAKEDVHRKTIEIYYINQYAKVEKIVSISTELSNLMSEVEIRKIINKRDPKAKETVEQLKMEITETLTIKDLQILARNEASNESGIIDFNAYNGRLTKEQVLTLKDLVRQTIIIGKSEAVASGGYRCPREENKTAQPVYVIDLAGLQFQHNDNSGRLVVIAKPSFFSSPSLPQGTLDDEIFQQVVGEKKATFEECQKDPVRYIPVTLNGNNNAYLDVTAYQRFVANDVVLTLTSLFAQLKQGKFNVENKKILFKFLKYGTGYFAQGLEPAGILNAHIGDAVRLGLQAVFKTNKEDMINYIGHISFPFYDEDQLLKKLCNDYGLNCDFNEIDGLKYHIDEKNLEIALTNTGDPHAPLGNEMLNKYGKPPSVDAAIAVNLKDSGNSFAPVLNQTMASKFIPVAELSLNLDEILNENPTSLIIRDLYLNHFPVEKRKEIILFIISKESTIKTIDLRGDHKLSRDLCLKLLGSKKFDKIRVDWKDVVYLNEFSFFDFYKNTKNEMIFDNDNLLKEIFDNDNLLKEIFDNDNLLKEIFDNDSLLKENEKIAIVKEIRFHEIIDRMLSDDKRIKDETSVFLLKILNDKNIHRKHKSTLIARVCLEDKNKFFSDNIHGLVQPFSLEQQLNDEVGNVLNKISNCKKTSDLKNIKVEFNHILIKINYFLMILNKTRHSSLNGLEQKFLIQVEALQDHWFAVIKNILKEENPDLSDIGKLLAESELKKFYVNDLMKMDKKISLNWQDISSMLTEKEFFSFKEKFVLKDTDCAMLQAIKLCVDNERFGPLVESKNKFFGFGKKTAIEITKLRQILADNTAGDYVKLIAVQVVLSEVKDERSEFYHFYENLKKLVSTKITQHKLTKETLELVDRIKNIDKKTDIITLNKLRDDCHNYCSNLVLECSSAKNSIDFQESQEDLMKQSRELINKFNFRVNRKLRPFGHKEIAKNDILKDIEKLTNLKELCEKLEFDNEDIKDLTALTVALTRLKNCDKNHNYDLADNISYEILQRKSCLTNLKVCLNELPTLKKEDVTNALNIITSLEKEIENHFFYEHKIAIVFERNEKGHVVMHIVDPIKRNFFLQSIEQQEISPELIKAFPKQYEPTKSGNEKFHTPVSMTDKALHFPTCSGKEGEMIVFGNHAKSFSKFFTMFTEAKTGREGKQERKTFFHKIHWHCGNGNKVDKLYFEDNIKTDECIVIMESGDYFKQKKEQIYFENFAKEPVKELVTDSIRFGMK